MNPDHADVVLLAAGAGTRLGEGRPKAFVELGGEPMFLRSLRTFLHHPAIDRVALVTPRGGEDALARACEHLGEGPPDAGRLLIVRGGERRQDSTYEGLRALAESGSRDDRVVLIHDAARPFASPELISRCLEAMYLPWGEPPQARLPGIRAAGAWGDGPAGVIPTLPVQDTLKLVYADRVVMTQPRENLQIAQTPQAFRLGVILDGHRRAREVGHTLTDDAAMLEWMGIPVRVVEGEGINWKITVPFDLLQAERWIRRHDSGEPQ
ncbi:MAG: 2-C-methyl-D-erythritol 4-phosphate cytidylyltransferase [Candidatus Eisenbacteria bacterium]|nr:2-C-methyl-D-erythritol 4-phosphate cytidylyltransferase [Candidatus Eisenbacteria bacterium]